jgi:hypothetical protein
VDELGDALLEVELDGRGHSPVFTRARRLRNRCQAWLNPAAASVQQAVARNTFRTIGNRSIMRLRRWA